MTTSPYSPDTAAAVSGGSTSQGFVGTGNPVTWDAALARYNLQVISDRDAMMAVERRNALAALRRELRAHTCATTAGVKILVIGDSIAAGSGSVDGTGWRGWLADRLDQRRIAATFATLTVPGDTLRDLAGQVAGALTAAQPAIVVLAFGTNDAAQPDLVDWQARFAATVDQILAFSPTVKVACAKPALSAPSWSVNEQTIGGYVDAVVSARLSGGRVATVDMSTLPPSWTGDGVHPQEGGYVVWAQKVDAAITPWLPAAP